MTVYRDYDQAGLDAQYNLRARVPEFAEHFAAWAAASEAARQAALCRLDLAYGATPAETLDFFPAPAAPAPCLLFIHGGYWQAMDKRDFSFIAPPFQGQGIAVAIVNYALAPSAAMDEIVRQCRAAFDWLSDNAGPLGIERDRLHVAGHSAGGHLTAMVLAAESRAGAPRPVGALAVSGLYDLEPIRLCYLNAVLGLDRAAAERNSPIRLAPPPGVPILLALGGKETPEFHRQQSAFAATWRDRGATLAEPRVPRRGSFHGDRPARRAGPSAVPRRARPDPRPGRTLVRTPAATSTICSRSASLRYYGCGAARRGAAATGPISE
jgi:arylformamidase